MARSGSGVNHNPPFGIGCFKPVTGSGDDCPRVGLRRKPGPEESIRRPARVAVASEADDAPG